MGGGTVVIADEAEPECPAGGLLVQTEACGLCSGELMDWYMDKKIPHVFGHEVSGKVIESQDSRFPAGCRVFPHHHAPCLTCDLCLSGRYVHCLQWKRTKLQPGGMAERFAVSRENLNDTLLVDDLSAENAALIEPLACVVKSLHIGQGQRHSATKKSAVIGLGAMGLLHLLMLPKGTLGYDLNASRVAHAHSIGLSTGEVSRPESANVIYVCPGSQAAFEFALSFAQPQAAIVMFAPLPPNEDLRIPQLAYFHDISIMASYSCGPRDTLIARNALLKGMVSADQVVSHLINLDELPDAYLKMKRGEILKPMVKF